jgi:signal transduction histidine kinase
VIRKYDPRVRSIEAYGSELNQVWTNLIDNALQAMGAEGELSLTTSREGDDTIIEICDTGPGIPPDLQVRIFEPFFTTKEPGAGTGLGLHLAYNIVVHRHGGRIRVDSVPGRTCFSITLPPHPRGKNER